MNGILSSIIITLKIFSSKQYQNLCFSFSSPFYTSKKLVRFESHQSTERILICQHESTHTTEYSTNEHHWRLNAIPISCKVSVRDTTTESTTEIHQIFESVVRYDITEARISVDHGILRFCRPTIILKNLCLHKISNV